MNTYLVTYKYDTTAQQVQRVTVKADTARKAINLVVKGRLCGGYIFSDYFVKQVA